MVVIHTGPHHNHHNHHRHHSHHHHHHKLFSSRLTVALNTGRSQRMDAMAAAANALALRSGAGTASSVLSDAMSCSVRMELGGGPPPQRSAGGGAERGTGPREARSVTWLPGMAFRPLPCRHLRVQLVRWSMQARSPSSPARPWRTRGRRSRRKRRRRRRSWRTSGLRSSWSSAFPVTGLRALLLTAVPTSSTAPTRGPAGPSRLAPPVGGEAEEEEKEERARS